MNQPVSEYESDNGQLLSLPSRRVKVSRIQQELDELWCDFHQDLSDGQAFTRACMSNLIVLCDSEKQSAQIERDIPFILLTHPARVMLLTRDGKSSAAGIQASVCGHYRVLHSGWQVCGEQISVVADANSERHLTSIVLSHLVGDLPTTLWWASTQPPPLAGKLFFQLAEMADQIIYDSIAWTNPTRGLQAMSRWVAAERNEYVIFNLAWRRLKPWRRLLNQVLDPMVHPGALDKVSHLTIEHGPNALPMALLLLGWLAYLLKWQPTDGKVSLGKETVWQFSLAGRHIPVTIRRLDSGAPTLHKLHWSWLNATTHNVVFALLGDERLGIDEKGSDVPVRVIAAPELERSALVSAQMAHRTRDKMFEQALEVANSMIAVLKT